MPTLNTSAQGASKDTTQEGASEMPKTDSQGVITDGDYLPSSEIDEEEEGLEINRIFERACPWMKSCVRRECATWIG